MNNFSSNRKYVRSWLEVLITIRTSRMKYAYLNSGFRKLYNIICSIFYKETQYFLEGSQRHRKRRGMI